MKEYLIFLKKLHDDYVLMSKRINFNKKDIRQLYLIGLYGSIIELTGCLIVLTDNKCWTGIPPLFRSLLETYVEFDNLYRNEEYVFYMDASFLNQWLNILENAKQNENPFLRDIAKSDMLDSQIKEHSDKLEYLKQRGFHPLHIFERFERAGLKNEYKSIYKLDSGHAHSNINALIDRHYDMSGDDVKVVFYKDKADESIIMYIDSIAGLLVDATEKVHLFFKTDMKKEIEEIKLSFSKLRERYK
jgi:hypothetical protein